MEDIPPPASLEWRDKISGGAFKCTTIATGHTVLLLEVVSESYSGTLLPRSTE